MPNKHFLDFSLLFCQYHPHELVTNFCNDQKCLVGLCATCVCSHTDMHAQLGNLPHYQNIRDTFRSLHDEVRNQITNLQEDKNILANLRQSVEIKKTTIKKTIKKLKQETLQKVAEEFDVLEKKVFSEMIAEEKRQGYHTGMRFQTLFKALTRETETLLGYSEGLNSLNFLQWVKRLKIQGLAESNQQRLKIQKEINDNKIYTANLKWNQDFLVDIQNIIKGFCTLEFIVPKPLAEPQNNFIPLNPTNLNLSIITRKYSQSKPSRSIIKSRSTTGLSKFGQSTSNSIFFYEPEGNIFKETVAIKMMGLEQSSLTRSTYISDDRDQNSMKQVFKNNSLNFAKSTVKNNPIGQLIEAKRKVQFENPLMSIINKSSRIVEEPRTRFY